MTRSIKETDQQLEWERKKLAEILKKFNDSEVFSGINILYATNISFPLGLVQFTVPNKGENGIELERFIVNRKTGKPLTLPESLEVENKLVRYLSREWVEKAA